MRFCTAEESRLFSKIGRFNSCTMVDNGWYKALSKNGSVMGAFAANVLARIVFNYRLADKKAPDGTVRKAFYFDGDKLQISYKTLSDAFSVSVASIKSAFDVLEEAGLVNREFRTVVMCGRKCPNTMFVSLNVERLISVSSFKGDGDGIGTTAGDPVHGMAGGDASPFETVSTYSFTLPYGGMEDAAMPDTAKEIPGTVSEIFTGGMPKKSDTCANDLTDQDTNKINKNNNIKNNNINNFAVSQSVNIQSPSLTGHADRPDGLYDDTPSKRDGDDALSSFKSKVGYEGLLLSYPGKKDLLDYIILVTISDCKEVLDRLCRENIESVLLGLSDRSDLSRIKNLQRYVAKAVKNSVGECLIKRAVRKTAGTACFGEIETAMRPQERHGGLYGAGGDMGASDGMGGRASFVLDGGKGIRYWSSRGSRNDRDSRKDKIGRRPRNSWERAYTPEEYDELERRLLSY